MAKKQAKPKKPKPQPEAQQASYVPADAVFVNPFFKWVLLTLITFFVGLVILAWVLSRDDDPNEMEKQLFTFAFNGGELILGAIVGLISGKGIDAFAYRVAPTANR